MVLWVRIFTGIDGVSGVLGCPVGGSNLKNRDGFRKNFQNRNHSATLQSITPLWPALSITIRQLVRQTEILLLSLAAIIPQQQPSK